VTGVPVSGVPAKEYSAGRRGGIPGLFTHPSRRARLAGTGPGAAINEARH